MTPEPLKVLCLGTGLDLSVIASGTYGPFEFVSSGSLADAADHDAVLIHEADSTQLKAWAVSQELLQAAADNAVVIVGAAAVIDDEMALLRAGVQEVADGAQPLRVARALRHAVERKRLERSARTAYATDLATGLPHQAQLIEHMTHLLALREREPSPMALLALRVEGFSRAAERLGSEAGNVLRRKVAVRLRGGLRASDVVASIGPETFGVLLGHLEAAAHAQRVGAKLVQGLREPFKVAGQSLSVSATLGLALVPEHGTQAEALLRRAVTQAASATVDAIERAGVGTVVQRRIGPAAGAANDEPG